jgi:hypothetical protein
MENKEKSSGQQVKIVNAMRGLADAIWNGDLIAIEFSHVKEKRPVRKGKISFHDDELTGKETITLVLAKADSIKTRKPRTVT